MNFKIPGKLSHFFLIISVILLVFYLISEYCKINRKVERLDTSDLPDNKSLYYKKFIERGFIYDKDDIVK